MKIEYIKGPYEKQKKEVTEQEGKVLISIGIAKKIRKESIETKEEKHGVEDIKRSKRGK